MLFTPNNAKLVMSGAKKQTRRLRKPGDYPIINNGKIEAVERNKRLLWEVGRIYSVQPGRGKHSIGQVKLVAIREQQLQSISDDDICAELGCPVTWTGPEPEPYRRDLRSAFVVLWNSVAKHGNKWQDNNKVWVLTLKIWERPWGV